MPAIAAIVGIAELLLALVASAPGAIVVAIAWRGGLFASSGERRRF